MNLTELRKIVDIENARAMVLYSIEQALKTDTNPTAAEWNLESVSDWVIKLVRLSRG